MCITVSLTTDKARDLVAEKHNFPLGDRAHPKYHTTLFVRETARQVKSTINSSEYERRIM